MIEVLGGIIGGVVIGFVGRLLFGGEGVQYAWGQAVVNALWNGSTLREPYQNKSYRFGASGPDYFDCSGLIYAGAASAGVSIPRLSSAQMFEQATPVTEEVARVTPGAMVFYRSRTTGKIHHVELSTGTGKILASWAGSGTYRQPASWGWWKGAQSQKSVVTFGLLRR